MSLRVNSMIRIRGLGIRWLRISGLLIEATWHCTKVLVNKGNILEGIGYIWLHMQRNIGIREVLQDIVLNLSGNIVGLL